MRIHRDAERLRVLVLFSSGDIGGAERSLTRMVLANDDPSIAYELATVGQSGSWSRWVTQQGIRVTSYGVFGGGVPRPVALLRLMRACRAARPSIIYAIGLRAAAVARLCRLILPGIRVVHGIRSTYPTGSPLARSFRVSESLLGWLTARYICNTARGATDLQALAGIPPGRMHVVHNGVESTPAVAPAASRAIGIAVTANINAYKGHLQFLNVIEHVHKRVPEVKAYFIGRNDLGDGITRAIEARGLQDVVVMTGYLPKPEQIVRDVRVVALPSPTIEGSPTAVLEAMSCGVPVVAYSVGGLLEIVQSGESGVLVSPGDEHGFAEALTRLILDTGLNDAMGASARTRIAEKFTLRACAQAHAAIWRSLEQSRTS